MQENSKEYVEYKSFDELPIELKEKFKSGARGLHLNKAKNAYVGFINPLNQQGDELVGDYTNDSTKTQVRFGKCGHVADISPNSYKNRRGCGVCSGKQVQKGYNDLATTHQHLAKEWHPTKNGEITPHDVTRGSGKKVWWQCESGHEWEASTNKRSSGRNCPYCTNHRVLKGFNDIETSHPHYVKYFVDINDACTHTYSSNKKVELKCPECGHIKHMKIGTLTKHGFSCDICSDGISYPEKLMVSILSKKGVKFVKQMSYDNGEHRYDFFLPKYDTILETHGIQHYVQSGRGRSLEEEQENDRYKRELAIGNGILNENYHEVDCRYSTLEWCRPNIEKILSNYMNMSILTDEDWKEADTQAQKSLKIEICKYWKDNKDTNSNLTPQRVADVFGMEVSTIRKYLKWGGMTGFCEYETDGRGAIKLVYLIKPNGDKWFEEAVSMSELARQTGISQPAIRNILEGGVLKHGTSAKYDPKYIGSYIVSAEVYDNQHQTNQNT